MADKQKLAKKWSNFRVSSSISNFKNKLIDRINLPEWSLSTIFQPALFIGMYHIGDYSRLLIHRNRRYIFWCGSDILNLEKTLIWKKIISNLSNIVHICENEKEQNKLCSMNIASIIRPTMFSNPTKFEPSFTPTQFPHVYLSCHQGREEEYGVNLIKDISPNVAYITFHIYGINGTSKNNIIYHGKVDEETFDQDIKNYHAGLRLNSFDGFGEVLAKSVLLGQYPISKIYYPHINHAPNKWQLMKYLRELREKEGPNLFARKYWYNSLKSFL